MSDERVRRTFRRDEPLTWWHLYAADVDGKVLVATLGPAPVPPAQIPDPLHVPDPDRPGVEVALPWLDAFTHEPGEDDIHHHLSRLP